MNGYDPFLVIIGGSDESSALSNCELYYPKTDTYYSFPSLKKPRENASSCIFNAKIERRLRREDETPSEPRQGLFIYCFGGFDKKSIDGIERIKITFSEDPNETCGGLHPVVTSKWEIIRNISMPKSVECCGTH